MMLRRVVRFVSLIVCAMTVLACRWPRTQLLVTVETDLPYGADSALRTVVISVRSGGPTGAVRLDHRRFDVGVAPRTPLPLSFGVFAQSEETDRMVWIEALGCGDDACATSAPIVTSRLLTRFDRSATRAVTLRLDVRCESIVCADAARTCSPEMQLCVAADDGLGGSATVGGDAASDASDAVESGATSVAAGGGTTCAVLSNGTTRCAGGYSSTWRGLTFADGTGTRSEVRNLLGFDDVQTLAVGDGHACALRHDGTVWCAGRNDHGQLGAGDRDAHAAPVRVANIADATAVTAGIARACALLRDGTVSCWGRQLDADSSPIARLRSDQLVPRRIDGVRDAAVLVSGDEYDCVLRRDRTVACRGLNDRGQLGDGTTRASSATTMVQVLGDVLGVSAGPRHACARMHDNHVRCWGEGYDGQRGDGRVTMSSTPTEVIGVDDAIRITAGVGHTCSRDSIGRVQCWGRNDRGQTGGAVLAQRESTSFVDIDGPVVDLVSGRDHTCARTTNGSVFCWGADDAGQLGTGRELAVSEPAPFGSRALTSVAVADGLTCGLDDDGVGCAGLEYVTNRDRGEGMYHEGTRRTLATITSIGGLPSRVVSLGVGFESVCAALADGSVRCWGANEYGQLGNDDTHGRSVPVQVAGLTDAMQVCVGRAFACARDRDGTVRCWGRSDYGELGAQASLPDRCQDLPCSRVPVTIRDLPPSSEIVCGEFHICSRSADGAVDCWGNNQSGQTSGAANFVQVTPVRVAPLPPVRLLAAGDRFTCASSDDGVRCWGADDSGILGNDAPPSFCEAMPCSSRPVLVRQSGSLGDSVEIAAGAGHVCVRRASGDVLCWGAGGNYQLGRRASTACRSQDCVRTPIPFGNADHATSLGLGNPMTCVSTDDGAGQPGHTYCAGFGAAGAIPSEHDVRFLAPTPIPELEGTSGLVGRGLNLCGFFPDGRVFCAGDNFSAQIGDGRTGNPRVPVRTPLEDIVEAANGGSSTCALRADGTVWCFGWNDRAQLGDGEDTRRSVVPHRVVGVDGAIHVAAGAQHGCAIVADHTVRCWGNNEFGQASGDGLRVDLRAAVTVPGLSDVEEVGLAGAHSCARTTDGHVWCWGDGIDERLGTLTGVEASPPTRIEGFDRVSRIAIDDGGGCAIREGSVWCWGTNRNGELGAGTGHTATGSVQPQLVPIGSDIDDLRAGPVTICAHHADGRNTCWGSNLAGQFGRGEGDGRVGPEDVPLVGLDEVTPLGFQGGWVCARRVVDAAMHSLVCWGVNDLAQLGDGTTEYRTRPSAVVGLDGVRDIYPGWNHTCALREDRSLWCWGDGSGGETADPNAIAAITPAQVHRMGETTALSAGWDYLCGLVSDGTVRCAGANAEGLLGRAGSESDVGVEIPAIENATQISAGAQHACVATSAATAICWGRGDAGELATPVSRIARIDPITVPGLTRVAEVASGGRHTCARRTDGSVWCWGANDHLQLGVVASATPDRCSTLGEDLLPSDHEWPCRRAPAPVPGLTDVVAIAAGGLHTCASKRDGSVWCWGADTVGQLGDGGSADRAEPSMVLSSGVVGLAASQRMRVVLDDVLAEDAEVSGDDATCAWRDDGSLWCWGRNDRGQLGDGTTTDRAVPTRSRFDGVTHAWIGGAHTCIERGAGMVSCFGDDSQGELGRGTTSWSAVPLRLAF